MKKNTVPEKHEATTYEEVSKRSLQENTGKQKAVQRRQ